VRALGVIAIAVVAACADLTGYSGGAAENAADAGADAAALPPDTVFADGFDDATPLPRAWDFASGAPVVVASEKAVSAPNVFRGATTAPDLHESFVRKTFTLSGKTSVECALSADVHTAPAGTYTTIMHLAVANDDYARVDVANTTEWKIYGQCGDACGFSDGAIHSFSGFQRVTLKYESSGRVTAAFGSEVRIAQARATDLSKVTLTVGLVLAPGDTAEVDFDDVRCSAQ